MQLQKIVFIPQAIIEFTEEEVNALFQASEAHYDHKCQEVSKQGGTLWGIRNRLTDGKAEAPLTWHEIDLLGKVAEQLDLTHRKNPALVARLRYNSENSFSAILRKLNEEYDRVNSTGIWSPTA